MTKEQTMGTEYWLRRLCLQAVIIVLVLAGIKHVLESRVSSQTMSVRVCPNFTTKTSVFTSEIYKQNSPIKLKYTNLGKPEICQKTKGSMVQFTALIFSYPESLERRMKFRKMLKEQLGNISGGQAKYSFEYQFIVGMHLIQNETLNEIIKKEEKIYGDMIRGDFIDVYENLNMKYLYSFHWLKTYCKAEQQYFLQIDDNIYFNISTLYKNFTIPTDSKHWIMGLLKSKVPPIRDPLHLHGVSKKVYPSDSYPDHVSGFAYIAPMNTVPVLYKSILVTPTFFLSDVYVTGMCREQAGGIKLVNNMAVCDSKESKKQNCFACRSCT